MGEGRGCLGRKSPLLESQGDTQKAVRFFWSHSGKLCGVGKQNQACGCGEGT